MAISQEETTEIINLTKQKLPQVPFSKIKNEVLGEDYELSLAFIGEKRSKQFNKKYRNKEKSASVLSFPFSEKGGEIFMTLKEIPKKAKQLNMSEKNTAAYLFIHSLLHLKGYKHGQKMEEQEAKFKHFFR